MGQHSLSSGGGSGGGGSFLEMASFFKEQRDSSKEELKHHRKEIDRQRKETEAKMEQQRKEMEAKIVELTPAPPAPPVAAITDEQLAALQGRIEGLHITKLLTDEELFALEDLIADYVELTVSVADGVITKAMIYAMPTAGVASKLDKLISLSEAMAGDAAFARQARRKFL